MQNETNLNFEIIENNNVVYIGASSNIYEAHKYFKFPIYNMYILRTILSTSGCQISFMYIFIQL